MFALFCAEQCRDKWKHVPEAVRCIELTELWLDGRASSEECRVAAAYVVAHADYADYAAYAAAYATAHAVANAANAAAYAAAGANAAYRIINSSEDKDKTIKEQWECYDNLLHFDEIAEQMLLIGEVDAS